jgi:tetratricopeptide (TPR) repeat protein
MKKTTALWTLILLVSFSCGAAAGVHVNGTSHSTPLTIVDRMQAPPQAAKTPQWKSREEYDAYNAMLTEKDPDKKIALAEAFVQKFSTSDFKSGAYLTEMQVYYSQGKSDKAVEVGKKVLEVDPDSVDALAFLSYVFPFTFNSNPPAWQASTPYSAVGTTIQAVVGGSAHLEVLTKAGKSGANAPPFAAGATVCENGNTAPCWEDKGALDQYVTTSLSRANSDAHHGLDLLQKIQKPANLTDAQFTALVNPKRAVFNGTVGFVALQNKDYATAITSLKAGDSDNPSDVYGFYRLGLAYLYSTPPDYDNAIWNIARAVALAQAQGAKDPTMKDQGDKISAFLKRAYVNYHGTDTGLSDIITQAAGSPNPPDGFKVTKAEAPKPTGNNLVDAFNTLTWPLKLGGETAQKQWDVVKGQPIALGGAVTSVEKSPDAANVYLVHIAILDSTKSADGYDIELKDSTQPNVKNLVKGDLVQYKGTLDSYVATPTMILTLVGEVTSDLPDKPPAKPAPKPRPGTRPTKKTTPPSN